MDEMEIYLRPTETIESDHEMIRKSAEKLIADCANDRDRAVALFNFVRDSVRYNIYMVSMYLDDFRASNILDRKKGYCVQKAVLLAALARAAGIPARLTFAKIQNHRISDNLFERLGTKVFPRHGYNQFYLDGRWVSAAATFDRDLCKRGGLPTVEFDGYHDALLPTRDLAGNPYIEYLKDYGPESDLPLEWIIAETAKIWGKEKRAWITRES